ncbi:MATE family efflux transporter [Sporosarcina sp. Marseille-Q4063]|uniref:MATE family efflux transporter n=1 Tax=Sporosarcina sp. Marseille-Q4063 TaxID=2810514 RepID=UPI001BAFB0B5|nr:MATE family efflux transporter [Sporosarcina sp. Marseille-Q4063]QUW22381.1 MATE family efflux transporter [Sporosarcina sp. Marseille-Q4063]
MNNALTLRNKPWKMAKIIMPILITQVAMYMITFFDILMTGRYDTYHLAGVTIGSSFWVPVYTGLAGILMALTPIIAQLVGARQKEDVRPTVQQGLYVSVALSAIVFLVILFAVAPILEAMPLEEQVRTVASDYLKGMSFGLLPLFAYTVMRSFFDALGATRVSMSVILLSAPINVLLNYLLIYGHWGFPELGGAGAGYASAITYWLVFFIACAIAWGWGPFVDYKLFVQWGKISFAKWKEILFIGVPIGISIFVEISIFSAVTLLMANYSTAVISAHQIALNFTSLLYMIPLSISIGTTILVGQEVGAGRMRDAKHYSYLSVGLAILFSFISITILLLFREQIASIYTNDINIVKLSVHFFIYAAIFQLSDAIQAPVQGALRGYKDVNVTFIMAIVSYWVIGLPVGYVMATYTELGPYGYWIGLITGLTVGAITLAIRLRFIQNKKFA